MIKIWGALLLLLFVATHIANAQIADSAKAEFMVDQMPEYPGGFDSLIREIASKIVYPPACRDSNIQGKVFVRFIVNEDGSISDIEAKAPHPLLKEAAVNAIKTLGRFKPGMDKGKPMKVWYNVPVSFRLQTDSSDNVEYLEPGITRDRKTGIFIISETPPEFPTGEAGLMKFIQDHVIYPEVERDNDISGRVLVKFVVDEEGKITDIKVAKSVSEGLDSEAVRVVRLLPAFKPGTYQGKPVKVYFNLPISFQLSEQEGGITNIWNYYNGGLKAFDSLLTNKLHYPDNAKANQVEANIMVKCKLNDDLKLSPVKVINDPDNEFTAEAMRVIKQAAAFDKSIKDSADWNEVRVVEVPFHLNDDESANGVSEVYYETGVSSFRRGEYKTAMNEFSDAIRTAPNPQAYYNRAITKLILNDLTGACGDFKRAYLLGELDALNGIQKTCK